MEYRADLHTHTTCSDGTCTPEELLHLAKEKNLAALSITDHDTMDAYTPEIEALAKKLGLILYPGIELSARYQKTPVHILGYGVQKTAPFLAFCAKHQVERDRRNVEILEKLEQKGMKIDFQELEGKNGRPHIAKLMVAKGYVKTFQEAFDKYIGERKPCYAEGYPFTVQETIDQIHSAHGKALIAHPHLIQKAGILNYLLGMNFDGLECYYSLLNYNLEKKWLKIAKEKNWLISGGSDFHGNVKPKVFLGCSWVDQETVTKLFASP